MYNNLWDNVTIHITMYATSYTLPVSNMKKSKQINE